MAGACYRCDDELGDAHPRLTANDSPEVDQHHHDFAAVVCVDVPGAFSTVTP